MKWKRKEKKLSKSIKKAWRRTRILKPRDEHIRNAQVGDIRGHYTAVRCSSAFERTADSLQDFTTSTVTSTREPSVHPHDNNN